MMNHARFAGAAAPLVVTWAVASGGDLTPPPGPVAPTMKTLEQVEPRTPIDSLPLTISQPGSYYLTGNLTTASFGIFVDAPDVTIDMMGFSITGSTPDDFYGIQVTDVGTDNATFTLRNGVIRRFEFGVVAFDGGPNDAGHTVIGVGAVEIGRQAIDMRQGNVLIRDCFAQRSAASLIPLVSSFGITADGGVIESCRAEGFGYGLAAVAGGLIHNSQAINCDRGAVVSDGMVRGCVLYNNTTANLQILGLGVGIDNYAP